MLMEEDWVSVSIAEEAFFVLRSAIGGHLLSYLHNMFLKKVYYNQPK